MERQKAPITLGFLALLASAISLTPSKAVAADLLIGTVSEARVHHDVGRAVCGHVQRTIEGTTCEALPLEGGDAAEPLAVLSAIRNGAIEIGIVQSDWQFHAFNGTGPVEFMDVKFDNLRSLFSLHGEPFTVVARRDANIRTLEDMAGKRVNIGNPGSGQRAIMAMVMAAKGWTRDSFQLTDELTSAEQSLALCHDRVQAMISTLAHPDPALGKTLELCNAGIVEVSGAEIDKLIAENSYLAATEVPGGLYENVEQAVATFGVMVTAVASEDMDDDQAFAIVQAVFDNLDAFKRLHPAFGRLVPERMMTDGLSAPLHPGAMRYFQERGLM